MDKEHTNKTAKSLSAFFFHDMKKQYKDAFMSMIFIIMSGKEPFFSPHNPAILVLVWYMLAFFVFTLSSYYKYLDQIRESNEAGKNGQGKTVRKTNPVSNWGFLAIKMGFSCLFQMLFMGIALIWQSVDFDGYMMNGRDYFMTIFMDTLVITVVTAYYSIIIDAASKVKGVRNKIKAMYHVFQLNSIKNFLTHVAAIIFLVIALIYSYNEFSTFCPIIFGVLSVIYLLCPIKDE